MFIKWFHALSKFHKVKIPTSIQSNCLSFIFHLTYNFKIVYVFKYCVWIKIDFFLRTDKKLTVKHNFMTVIEFRTTWLTAFESFFYIPIWTIIFYKLIGHENYSLNSGAVKIGHTFCSFQSCITNFTCENAFIYTLTTYPQGDGIILLFNARF